MGVLDRETVLLEDLLLNDLTCAFEGCYDEVMWQCGNEHCVDFECEKHNRISEYWAERCIRKSTYAVCLHDEQVEPHTAWFRKLR